MSKVRSSNIDTYYIKIILICRYCIKWESAEGSQR